MKEENNSSNKNSDDNSFMKISYEIKLQFNFNILIYLIKTVI